MFLTRIEGWPEKLMAEVELARTIPFMWGLHDCCIFVADCVYAITGEDLAHNWRDRYYDEASMQIFLASQDLTDLTSVADALAAENQLEQVDPRQGRRGDIYQFDTLLGPTLGVLVDSRIVTTAPQGTKFIHLEDIIYKPNTRTWKVG